MQVLKFGGSSLADAAIISKVTGIVSAALEEDRTIMVCSAISHCTDTLVEIGRKAAKGDSGYQNDMEALKQRHLAISRDLLPEVFSAKVSAGLEDLFGKLADTVRGVELLEELSPRSLSAIQSFGERFSTLIIAAKFNSLGIKCQLLDSTAIVRLLPGGKVDTERTYGNVRLAIDSHSPLFIVPGFIASDAQGHPATLGRGGSDYTASLFAVGIKARRVEIWTDVPGIMTANPKIVPAARTISNISYRAAQELSHFGAKVIYPPTIQPVIEEGIPIYVKNSFEPAQAGSLVEKYPPQGGEDVIGISNSGNIALISLEGSGMVGVPGVSSRLFDALSRAGINIILITQASSVHTMCIAISESDAPKAKESADNCFAYEISLGILNPLKVEYGYSIVCLIGNDVLGHSGSTGKMLDALGKLSIPVRATAQGSSERNVSVIVPSDREKEAIRAIHRAFFEKGGIQDVNLFIAGFGTVGRALVQIVCKNSQAIAARTGKNVRICGIANSRHFLIRPEGMDYNEAAAVCSEGENAGRGAYIDRLLDLRLENSVFVDCTADPELGFRYAELFRAGYPVVTCNKIPFSGTYEQYQALKTQALKAGVGLRYETTAGAALPILETIDKVLNCGDRILRIEAVISGTLGYIFDRYDGSRDFSEVVEEAKAKGYTEPDPSIDLSGKDVLRKLLILSRQTGIPLEESQIDMEAVPDSGEIVRRHAEAKARGLKLRYIASLSIAEDLSYKASCRLEAVGPDSPLYWLRGTDNAAVITTEDYPSPLLIQGAGAGARQTAGGILGDILASL